MFVEICQQTIRFKEHFADLAAMSTYAAYIAGTSFGGGGFGFNV